MPIIASRSYLLYHIAVIIILTLSGCADRNDPVYPVEEYALVLKSQTQTPGWAQDVWVYGDTVFIADSEQGVTIWDASAIEAPMLIDTVVTFGSALGVKYAPQTGLLLVSTSAAQGGVTYYDLAEERRVNTLFDAGLEGFGFVELSSDTIVVAEVDRSEGFRVFDVYFDPLDSIWIDDDIRGAIGLPYGTVRGLYFDFETAYIANNQFGLTIAGITYSPLNNDITLLGNVDTPGAARDVALNADGTVAVVADYQAGLALIDVSDKTNPSLISHLLPSGVDQAERVVTRGDTAYFIDRYNGMFAVDISIPEAPVLIGRYDTPTPTGIFVGENQTIYLSDEDLGLLILEWR